MHYGATLWCAMPWLDELLTFWRSWGQGQGNYKVKYLSKLLFCQRHPHWNLGVEVFIWFAVHWTVVDSVCYNYHRLNGSSSPVLTATPHSYGKGQNSTPYKIKTPERIGMKFDTVHYVLEICPQNKFGDDWSSRGFWVNMWNIWCLWLYFFPNRPGALFTKGRKQLSHVRRSQTVSATPQAIHETRRWCDDRKCGRKLSQTIAKFATYLS